MARELQVLLRLLDDGLVLWLGDVNVWVRQGMADSVLEPPEIDPEIIAIGYYEDRAVAFVVADGQVILGLPLSKFHFGRNLFDPGRVMVCSRCVIYYRLHIALLLLLLPRTMGMAT